MWSDSLNKGGIANIKGIDLLIWIGVLKFLDWYVQFFLLLLLSLLVILSGIPTSRVLGYNDSKESMRAKSLQWPMMSIDLQWITTLRRVSVLCDFVCNENQWAKEALLLLFSWLKKHLLIVHCYILFSVCFIVFYIFMITLSQLLGALANSPLLL